jgi:hypothetical protein
MTNANGETNNHEGDFFDKLGQNASLHQQPQSSFNNFEMLEKTSEPESKMATKSSLNKQEEELKNSEMNK